MDQEGLQKFLAGMSDDYAQELPQKLAHIELLWRELASGNVSRRDELLRTAHSMAGAAATFGLPKVGDVAFELEHLLQPVCSQDGAPADGAALRIEEAIARLLSVSRSPRHDDRMTRT